MNDRKMIGKSSFFFMRVRFLFQLTGLIARLKGKDNGWVVN